MAFSPSSQYSMIMIQLHTHAALLGKEKVLNMWCENCITDAQYNEFIQQLLLQQELIFYKVQDELSFDEKTTLTIDMDQLYDLSNDQFNLITKLLAHFSVYRKISTCF